MLYTTNHYLCLSSIWCAIRTKLGCLRVGLSFRGLCRGDCCGHYCNNKTQKIKEMENQMDKKSTVLLISRNILQGDSPNIPMSLTSEIKRYDDGVIAIKFPGQALSSVGMSNIIRDILDSPNVKPRKTFYKRYGSIWVVSQDGALVSVKGLKKWLKGAPELQSLFEERADGYVKFLPFENKRRFFVQITAKALAEVPEIQILWRTHLYSDSETSGYSLLLTSGTPVKEVVDRIDWGKHVGVVISRYGEGKYIIHLESEPVEQIPVNLGVQIAGTALLQYSLCARNTCDAVSVSGQEGCAQSATKTTNACGATGYVSSTIEVACEQRLEQAYKIIEDKDEFIQVLQKRLERFNNSILELSTKINVLELENRNSKTQREQARKAIKDLAERLARMSDNNRDFHSKVIELETANESLKVQLKLARSVSTAIDKQKDLPKNAFEPKYLVVKGVKYRV